MRTIAIESDGDLGQITQLAAGEELLILRDGEPVGLFIPLEYDPGSFQADFENDPKFQEFVEMAQIRQRIGSNEPIEEVQWPSRAPGRRRRAG